MNMPILTQFQSNIQTMSSREVSSLTGKRHDHVKRDIEVMLAQLNLDIPKFGGIYFDDLNRKQTEYHLDKKLSLCLVSGYSVQLRMAIIDRWEELEKQTRTPQSFAEALQLAADQARQLELQAPKVAHYDTVVAKEHLLTATQVASKLRMSAVALNRILDEFRVYNKAHKRSRVFNTWFEDQGLGELKQTTTGHSQPMFTTKGEAWVIEKLVSEGVAA